MPVLRRAVGPVLLLAFALGFYGELGPGGRIALSFDPLGYFIPGLIHLGQGLRALRLPLWDPYLFGGVPFLANSQTGVLYPPNWLSAVLSAPRAFAWLVVLHAALGTVGAYLFARRALGLGLLGGMATALIFEFGGWTAGQAAHLNQFEAVAWLPFVLLVFDCILRAPTVRLGVLGGVLIAIQFLAGHTQTVYLSAWVLALYVGWVAAGKLLRAARSARDRQELPAWIGGRAAAFGIVGIVAVGLSAPQLLPTLELSGLSIRAAGLDFGLAASFSLRPFLVLQGLLPTYGEPSINAEWLGYVGVTGLLLAGTALATRPDRRALGLLLVALLGLALAFGEFTPVFGVAYRHVPGVGLFRVPARWLFVYTAAIAGLAGVGLHSLTRASAGEDASEARLTTTSARRVVLSLLAMLAGLGALLELYARVVPAYPMVIPGPLTLLLWAAAAIVGLALVAAALGSTGSARRVAPVLLLAMLAAELSGASFSLGTNQTGPDQVASGTTPEIDLLRAAQASAPAAPFRILGVGARDQQIADKAALASALPTSLSTQELGAFLDSIRNRELQTPNLPLGFGLQTIDGYDGGVLPLQRYIDLKALFPQEGDNVIDGRLWVQLKTAPDPKLLAWLNVRYLLVDRSGDLRLDGIDYDMAMPRSVAPGASLALSVPQPLDASALGLVSHLEDGSASAGTEVAVVTVETADGRSVRLPISAGVETAAGKPAAGVLTPTPVAHSLQDPNAQEYAARLALPAGTQVTKVTVQNVGQAVLTVRALSLLGATGPSRIVDLSPEYRLVYVGDTKVYENLAVLPRAYVVGRVRVVADDRAAIDVLRSSDFSPREEAVVTATALRAAGIQPVEGSPASVQIADYSDERVAIDADLAAPGLLVLADANYPGWRAVVDGVDRQIVTTDYLFRGVWLESGKHHVEFLYEPASFSRGLQLGGVALLLSLALVALGPRLERWGQHRD